jgi:hypothetical protein
MQNENYKKKNDLMKSIMSNPKMARSFRDAMAAPIGSTKREEAKSILSIMKKVGGLRNDGMGGPLDGFMSPANQSSPISTPSSNSYYIFPSAPKLKTTTSNTSSNPLTDIKNMFASNPVIQNVGNTFSSAVSSIKNPTINNNISSPVAPKQTNMSMAPTSNANMSVAPSSNANMSMASTGQPGGSTPAPAPTTTTTGVDAIKKLQSDLNTKNAGQPGWVPLVVDGIMGAKTTAAQTFVPISTSNNNTGNVPGNTGGATKSFANDTTNTNNTNTGTPSVNYKSDAAKAIKEGTGPGLFAMTEANAKFGGSLDQYINNLDEKLQKDFNLEPLEVQLSNLKAESENFIPTLTAYMAGKNKYGDAIDELIEREEKKLPDTNMADPFTANQYQNYMTYLYTLKSRQDGRYANYLSSAVSDYNADVTKLQSNYDNVYKRYTDALTRQGTIAQNEYNTLYTTMADLYTNLENAPIKAQNAKILQQQIDANNVSLLQSAVGSGTLYEDYYKDKDMLIKDIGDKDGNLVPSQLDNEGLYGVFSKVIQSSGDPKRANAAAAAINSTMAKALAVSTDPIKDVNTYKKLIKDLSSYEGGDGFASMITPTLNQNSYPLVSDYVLKNLSTIKNAATQLVEGKSSFFGKNTAPGLKDEAGWKKNFSSIDSSVLDDLYNHAQMYASDNPSSYVSNLFAGSGDKDIANKLTSSIMSTW